MKSASDATKALLASGAPFHKADLFTFTLSSGMVWHFTSADADIKLGDTIFSSFAIKRGRIRTVRGVQVDTLDISLFLTGTYSSDVHFLESLNNGLLDGARVLLKTVCMPIFGDTSGGAIHLFSGSIADVAFGRTETALTVKSDLQLLDTNMPRNLYQPGCLHSLYDDHCGVAKASYIATGTVGSGSTRTSLASGLTQIAGYFDMGSITFTSGQNVGLSYTVKTHAADGSMTLIRPTLFQPAVGDSFTAAPGCDKTQATCTVKFDNLPAFRGYPYIPAPETAY